MLSGSELVQGDKQAERYSCLQEWLVLCRTSPRAHLTGEGAAWSMGQEGRAQASLESLAMASCLEAGNGHVGVGQHLTTSLYVHSILLSVSKQTITPSVLVCGSC